MMNKKVGLIRLNFCWVSCNFHLTGWRVRLPVFPLEKNLFLWNMPGWCPSIILPGLFSCIYLRGIGWTWTFQKKISLQAKLNMGRILKRTKCNFCLNFFSFQGTLIVLLSFFGSMLKKLMKLVPKKTHQ